MARKGTKTGTETVVILLAEGKSVAATSASTGVSKRTIWRWLKDPAVKAQITEVRRQLVDVAVGRLSAHSAPAASRLHKLSRSKTEAIALGASRAILDAAIKLREHAELADRVAALEDRLSAQQSGTPTGDPA